MDRGLLLRDFTPQRKSHNQVKPRFWQRIFPAVYPRFSARKSDLYDNSSLLISGLPDSALGPHPLICTRTI